MSHTLLINIARVISILGLGLLTFSAIGGTLLASRTAQKIKFLKGQTFKYHRTLSLGGAALFLLHPILLLLAHTTTGMRWWNVVVPFTAPKQGVLIAWGTLAAYTLIIVTLSSLNVTEVGIWDRAGNLEAWACYLGGEEADHYAAPTRATDLAGLPPAFIDVGEMDMFRDEDFDFAMRLNQAGVPTEFHVHPGAFHASEIFAPEAALSQRIWAGRLAALTRFIEA